MSSGHGTQHAARVADGDDRMEPVAVDDDTQGRGRVVHPVDRFVIRVVYGTGRNDPSLTGPSFMSHEGQAVKSIALMDKKIGLLRRPTGTYSKIACPTDDVLSYIASQIERSGARPHRAFDNRAVRR